MMYGPSKKIKINEQQRQQQQTFSIKHFYKLFSAAFVFYTNKILL